MSIYCYKMREMLSFKKIEDIPQNFSSINDEEGVFILNEDGAILFANSKAKIVFSMESKLKELIKGQNIKIREDNREIIVYPLLENNQIKFFFGVVKDLYEMEDIKKVLDITYDRVKSFKEDIAHYFFNPIVIAKGYLNLLSDKNLEPHDKEKIEKIKIAIERIEAVVKNIVVNGKIVE